MPSKTRKQKKVLCYTGIGANKTGIHTPEDFLKITEGWQKNKEACYTENKNKYVCPKPGNLNGWMKHFGAVMIDETLCRKSGKEIYQRMRKIHMKTLRNIKTGKLQKNFEGILPPKKLKKYIHNTKKGAENYLQK